MNKEEHLLFQLVDYMDYLEKFDKSSNWNRGYFKKLKKLLIKFCNEYTANHWNWY